MFHTAQRYIICFVVICYLSLAFSVPVLAISGGLGPDEVQPTKIVAKTRNVGIEDKLSQNSTSQSRLSWTRSFLFLLLLFGNVSPQAQMVMSEPSLDDGLMTKTPVLYGTPKGSLNDTLFACSHQGTFDECRASLVLSEKPKKDCYPYETQRYSSLDLTEPRRLFLCLKDLDPQSSPFDCFPFWTRIPPDWQVTEYGRTDGSIASIDNFYSPDLWIERWDFDPRSIINYGSNPTLCVTREGNTACLKRKHGETPSCDEYDEGCENEPSAWSGIALHFIEVLEFSNYPWLRDRIFSERSLRIPFGSTGLTLRFPLLGGDHAEKYKYDSMAGDSKRSTTDPGMAIMIRGVTPEGWSRYNWGEPANPHDECAHVILVKGSND